MNNKKTAVMFAVCLSTMICSVAQAQRTPVVADDMPVVEIKPPAPRVPGEFNEVQYWLDEDDKARFDGVIVNPEGWAYILSEYDSLKERSQAALEAQRAADLAYINLELGKVLAEWEADQRKAEVQIAAREEDLRRCQKINEEIVKNRTGLKKKFLVGAGAGAVGVVLGIVLQAFVF